MKYVRCMYSHTYVHDTCNLPTLLHGASPIASSLHLGPPGGNPVGRGSLDSDTQTQLQNATDEVFRLYVTVGGLVAVILILLVATIVLVICFCKNRSVVYTLPPMEDNCYTPPLPSKQAQV